MEVEFLKDDLVIYVPNHLMLGGIASPSDLCVNLLGHPDSAAPVMETFYGDCEWMLVSSQNEGGVFCKPYHHRNGTSQRANRENLLNISHMFRTPLSEKETEQLICWYKLKGRKVLAMKKEAYDEVYHELFDVDRFNEMRPVEILDNFNNISKTLHFMSFGSRTIAPFNKYIILR